MRIGGWRRKPPKNTYGHVEPDRPTQFHPQDTSQLARRFLIDYVLLLAQNAGHEYKPTTT